MDTQQKLPRAFKNKWVKALRSGEYKQGKRKLHNTETNTFCCLGVACDIAGTKIMPGADFISSHKIVRGITKIPKILRGDCGIPEKLANMNDSGKSFSKIADYIEQNL